MTNRYKEKSMRTPIENHQTAAWTSHIVKNKEEGNVQIPSDDSVRNAKDYVDANQK
jgi:hypothetical protein